MKVLPIYKAIHTRVTLRIKDQEFHQTTYKTYVNLKLGLGQNINAIII